MRKILLFTSVFMLLLLPLTFAFSSSEWPQQGHDFENTANGFYNADYETNTVTGITFPHPVGMHRFATSYQPIIANVDDDPEPELAMMFDTGWDIYEFQSNGNLIEDYNTLSPGAESPGWSQALFYDSDDDGDSEFFYCNRDGGNSEINAVMFENGTANEMWSYSLGAVGNNDPCALYKTSATSAPAKNTTIAPTAHIVNGTRYVFFFTQGANNDKFNIVRLNAQTGAATVLDTQNIDGAGCTGIRTIGLAAGTTLHPQYGNDTNDNNFQPTTQATFCPNPDTDDILYVASDCYTGGSDYTSGVIAVRPDIMQAHTTASNGFVELSVGTLMKTAPACYQQVDNTGKLVMVGVAQNGPNDVSLYSTDSTGNFVFKGTQSTSVEMTSISDLFLGEYSSDIDIEHDDVCFFYHDENDGQLGVFCGDIDGGFGQDTVLAETSVGIDFQLSHFVATPSPGNYLATPNVMSDVVTNYGMYKAIESIGTPRSPYDFDNNFLTSEGLQRHANSFPSLNGHCVLADVDMDAFADVFCMTPSNLSLYISGNLNSPVDFKRVGVDVIEEDTMCQGTQTFFLHYDSGLGYQDAESDDVYAEIDCTSNGTFVNTTGFAPHTTNWDFGCEYLADGSYQATVRMHDSVNLQFDAITHTTVVENITECTIPDNFSSGFTNDVIEVPPEPPGEELPAFGDFTDSANSLLTQVGGSNQNSKDFIIIVGLGLLGYSFVAGGAGSWLVAGGVILLGVVATTLTGLLSPVYMVVMIVFMIFAGVVWSGLLSKGSM